MTGPMPSLLPGYSCWTALASTWAAEWRITSSAAPLLPLWLMMDRTSFEWSVVSDTKTPPALGRGGYSRFHPSFRLRASRRTTAAVFALTTDHRPLTTRQLSGAPVTERGRGRLVDLHTKEAVRHQAHRWFSPVPRRGTCTTSRSLRAGAQATRPDQHRYVCMSASITDILFPAGDPFGFPPEGTPSRKRCADTRRVDTEESLFEKKCAVTDGIDPRGDPSRVMARGRARRAGGRTGRC